MRLRLPSGRTRMVAIAIAALVVALLLLPLLITPIVGARLRTLAHARGFEAHWLSLQATLGGEVTLRGLTVIRPDRGDTIFRTDSLVVRIAPASLLAFHPRPAAVSFVHADLMLPARATSIAADNAEAMPEPSARPADPRRAERVRHSVEGLIRLLTRAHDRLPRLAISDLTLRPEHAGEALWDSVSIGWLEHAPDHEGGRLSIAGTAHGERDIPFEASATVAHDGGISGAARFGFPDPDGGATDLDLTLAGRLRQNGGRVVLDPDSRVTVGQMPFRLGGYLDRHGPALGFRLAADSLTQTLVEASLPRSVIGPLHDLGVRGRWDYRLSLDLDLSQPDSVRFAADVIPHGLTLDPDRTFLNVLFLDRPFTATIHLPHDRTVERAISLLNPHYRPLDRISPELVQGVVTNEDGGFYTHRGFNTRALREAIAEDVKTGSFKRGAGTITMQLVRNLYLGHQRTLSRKFQEVALAWVLEHLTGLSKQRMLEIYLNIIEWGPDIHGADEAARFYFGRDAGDLTPDQALFLVTLVPSPTRWRNRFDRDGALRPFARAQMHFIGRAMIAKGWLAPEKLPDADSLQVVLAGPAKALLAPQAAPADTTAAAADTSTAASLTP
ncbi:MAG TPA: biosynthetic peptidoglycan transglycosylase [Dongiaceae bacterium]|nr:biosynthetic peptidoglycan transglycosylase [Dongiaceae bacterium]